MTAIVTPDRPAPRMYGAPASSHWLVAGPAQANWPGRAGPGEGEGAERREDQPRDCHRPRADAVSELARDAPDLAATSPSGLTAGHSTCGQF